MSSPENENLSVKIVTADYYLHKPVPELGDQCYSAFRSSPIYRVPVIRIFGPTSEGVKTCLHVHGVFPYVFVPNWNVQIGEKGLYNFAANLDKAINTSFAHSNSKSYHVHKITRVSGMPFYGYHESERDFLKIEFYNPAMVKRASDLLLNGAVLNTIFQPHEAHIPYILQFFIDNNLYGMNNITFSAYKVRRSYAENDLNIDESVISSSSGIRSQSYSKLEIDITVSNLCNDFSNKENIPNNPGLAFIWEDEKKRRRFNEKTSQITPNESQQRPEKPVTRTERYFREKLIQKLQAIKNNETCMDMENDETPSSSSTYEELNTQSKSLLEILQSLAGQQEKSKEGADSGSSSPSLVYSDDENNAVDVSLISSQPLLKFNAEDDSILGNNFSDDENDIDDHDHKALSQSINYSGHQNMSSSEDSDAEIRGIPQLDGAYDTKSSKKPAAKKVKTVKPRQKVIKLSSNIQNQDIPSKKRTYNLRSQRKPAKESDQNGKFEPREFQIILKKLDPPKISPRKTYPRLNIYTQKSPRSNSSKSSQDFADISTKEPKLMVPRLPTESSETPAPRTRDESYVPSLPVCSSAKPSKPDDSTVLKFKEPILSLPQISNKLAIESSSNSISRTRRECVPSLPESSPAKASKPADCNISLQKSDKKVYPQLEISIKKSPRSSQKPTLDEALPTRGVSSLHGLKKRKINFNDVENESTKSKETIQDADLISPRWKKSLKRRKTDDTSFKIGNSFSLLEFRKSKKDQSAEKVNEKLTSLDELTSTSEMNSQNFSLRISAPGCSNTSGSTAETSGQEDKSVEMEKLQISDDEQDANVETNKSNVEKNRKLATSQLSDLLPLMECDDESLLAVPLDAIGNDEIALQKDSLAKSSSNSSIIKCPVLRIPRLHPDMMNNSVSSSCYENSSIELNISDPDEDSRTNLNEDPSSATSELQKKSTPDPQKEPKNVATSQSTRSELKSNENSNFVMSNFLEKVLRDSKDELMNVASSRPVSKSNVTAITSQSISERNVNATTSLSNSTRTTTSSQNKPNPIKVPKKSALPKKKSLGMRIRKNIKQVTSYSKSTQNTSATSTKNIDDGKSVEQLPMILVDPEDGQDKNNHGNLATSLDQYPDSNIELNIACTSDLLSKSSDNEVKTSTIKTNVCLATSQRDTSNSANSKDASCKKNVSKRVTKLTSPPCFEDSQIELDISKFCSESFEDTSKDNHNVSESVQNRNLAMLPISSNCNKADNYDQTKKAVLSPSIFNDSDVVCSQVTSPVQKIEDNEKLATSRSLSNDEILNEPNVFPSDAAIDDNDTYYSQAIAFDHNPLLNENLATSQSIFSDELPFQSNIKLQEVSLGNNCPFHSQEFSSQQNLIQNKNLATSQYILDDEILEKSTTALAQQLINDNDTLFSQVYSNELDNNVNRILATSPSFFSDDLQSKPAETSQNPNTIAGNDDLNASCSNDSLLNVLDSLTPRTKEDLNRKLNSFEEENLPTSFPQQKNVPRHLPSLAEPNHESSDDILDDSIVAGNVATLSQLRRTETRAQNDSTHSESLEHCSSNVLNKSTYTLNLGSNSTKSTREPPREKILFEEDSFDLELSATSSSRCENESVKKISTLDKLILNNSIWDSTDSDESTQEDNEIQSFYHNQTDTPAHITIIRDIAENDDESSPIAKSLTPESQTSNEILSFYGSQSPESMICSISQDLPKAPEAKSTPVNESTVSEMAKRRAARTSSPVIPHSTPAGPSTKKTPSPLYTPILKKLMIKKVNEKDKRRISSQRFRADPFLSEIEEEDETKKKEPDKRNTTLSLPLELECDVSKIDGKSPLNTSKTSSCSGASYQIDGATLENTCGFKMNLENLQDIKTDKQFQFITLISLEVFAQTRGDLKPDPEYDPVTCLFYSIHHDAPELPNLISGIIVVSEDPLPLDLNRFKCEKTVVSSEAQLFDTFLALIRKWDPDMFIGYEVEMLSWGFLIQRGYFLNRNLSQELSRIRETKQNEPTERPSYENDEYSNEIKLPGRIVLNVWRLMRHEVNLQSYTFENILFHVLHQRVPYHGFKFLTECWKNTFKRWIVVEYFLFRAESNITLLEQLDFICRTSELARLFGIQFYEVLSRGSQFRVESMMLRLAKTQNYVAVSPSVKQRAHMRAPESLPLIMEPESKFYTDPVIVLDFQSLYPSIIIAYNYCFSTCLGRIDSLGQNEPFHFGCVEHIVPGDLLVKLENSLNLSPAGVAFVDKTIRKGILPSMLEEILETRLMVKKSMKENKNNSILKRVLHARQLGLKLIANVTYGYTSANFSGRMPCMEIADSVVSKGRETLERAIELVNGTEKWGARVVYGDTDSLFVLVPNRSKEEAFRIGNEIVDAVTNQNPKPVKLKLEKVYTASILQTKKRYVGYMYESPDQEKPVYDAKGIETVRRDGCPAVSKILEKSLKLLFETKNVNTVKQYVQRQFTKLIAGRISIQELTFAREYRGLNNYKPAACVPALQLAKQALLKDRRAEPRIKERVRYVIATGAPGVPLIRLVRTPQEFLDMPGSLINTEYYITRAIIPALARCFTLMNVSVLAWYKELPKKQKLNLPIDYEFRNKAFKKTTISHYFSSSKCISCSKVAGGSVCRQCEHKPQRLALILGNMINQWQRKHNNVAKICRSCCARNEPIGCSSLDCPVYYLFRQTEQDAEQVRYAENLKLDYLHF